jgi:hypothetical protein
MSLPRVAMPPQPSMESARNTKPSHRGRCPSHCTLPPSGRVVSTRICQARSIGRELPIPRTPSLSHSGRYTALASPAAPPVPRAARSPQQPHSTHCICSASVSGAGPGSRVSSRLVCGRSCRAAAPGQQGACIRHTRGVQLVDSTRRRCSRVPRGCTAGGFAGVWCSQSVSIVRAVCRARRGGDAWRDCPPARVYHAGVTAAPRPTRLRLRSRLVPFLSRRPAGEKTRNTCLSNANASRIWKPKYNPK